VRDASREPEGAPARASKKSSPDFARELLDLRLAPPGQVRQRLQREDRPDHAGRLHQADQLGRHRREMYVEEAMQGVGKVGRDRRGLVRRPPGFAVAQQGAPLDQVVRDPGHEQRQAARGGQRSACGVVCRPAPKRDSRYDRTSASPRRPTFAALAPEPAGEQLAQRPGLRADGAVSEGRHHESCARGPARESREKDRRRIRPVQVFEQQYQVARRGDPLQRACSSSSMRC
jgi:hypothetical protein